MTTHPCGLRLYDPRTNELRTIALGARQLDSSRGVLLAYGTRHDGLSASLCGTGGVRCGGVLLRGPDQLRLARGLADDVAHVRALGTGGGGTVLLP